jgi:hypothetical protein
MIIDSLSPEDIVPGNPRDGVRLAAIVNPAIMDESTIIAFPTGNEPKEVYSLKLALRWDLSDMMSLIGEIKYNYDRNQLGRHKDTVAFTAEYYMRDPHVFGLGIFAQARF